MTKRVSMLEDMEDILSVHSFGIVCTVSTL